MTWRSSNVTSTSTSPSLVAARVMCVSAEDMNRHAGCIFCRATNAAAVATRAYATHRRSSDGGSDAGGGGVGGGGSAFCFRRARGARGRFAGGGGASG
eukprot:31203-Pelagococcus_subviridis.AAC.1